VLPLRIDLTEDDVPSRIVEAALERVGSIDVLVNCAGIFASTLALGISRNEWERVFGINLRAPFVCFQEIVRWAVKNGRSGSIVNAVASAGVVARRGGSILRFEGGLDHADQDSRTGNLGQLLPTDR
jgi:NAD(P)-dependent dehydrogenase (short-subunit alcohol dehydrogenase family)